MAKQEKPPVRNNPLYAVGGKSEKPMSQEEVMQTFAPEEEVHVLPTRAVEQPSAPAQSVDLPPAPQARRTTRKMRFTDLYETRSLSIDKRLLPYFDDLMENGPNKTVVANQWVLKILLDAGYKLDPQILTKTVIKPD